MKPLFSNSAIAATVGSLVDEICSFKRIVKLVIGPYRIKSSVHLPLDALRTESEGSFSRTGKETELLDFLASTVDNLRKEAGKPSIAEEANSLLEQRQEYAPIPFQQGSRCICGSDAALVIERRVFLRAHWETGNTYYSGDLNPTPAHKLYGLRVPIQPGELARCPDCGQSYSITQLDNSEQSS